VYSLGATLYELLTLRPAVDGADKQETLKQIAFEEPAAPRQVDKAIPAELETVALKCLAKNPAERYATAGELADDLRRWLSHQTIKAKPPTLRQKAAKWTRRHRPLVGAAAVALLATAAALGGAVTWVARDANDRRMRAEQLAGAALADAEQLQQEAQWPQALEMARRAKGRVDDAAAGGALRRRVEETLAGLELVGRLEDVRQERANAENAGGFEPAWADREYARAFRDFGLDVDALGPDELAGHIPPGVRDAVTAALDDWISSHQSTIATQSASPDPQADSGRRASRLVAAAQRLDPDEWRGRLRAATAARDRQPLVALAAEEQAKDQPAAALAHLGVALWRLGARQEAVAALRAAHRRYPGDFWVNFQLAEALEQSSSGDAVAFATAALALRPQSAGAYTALGRALIVVVRSDAAIAAFRQALRLRPDYFPALHYLAWALSQKGDLGAAEAVVRERIRRRPDDGAGYWPLHGVFVRAGDYDGALAAIREACRLAPTSPTFHTHLGLRLRDAGDWDGAFAAFEKAYQFGAGRDALLGRILTLRLKGDWAGVVVAHREAVRRFPDLPEADVHLGYALEALGDRDGAVAAWRDALRRWDDTRRLDPKECEAYTKPAHLLATCGDERIRDPRRAAELARPVDELLQNPWTIGNRNIERFKPGEPCLLMDIHLLYLAGDWAAAAANAEAGKPWVDGRHKTVETDLVIAMAGAQIGDHDRARAAYGAAAAWLDRTKCRDPLLCRLRAEAAELLGVRGGPRE
jgi:tetratricopeptide (TPR) repeat protein